MKKWTMALSAGLLLFTAVTTVEAKPNNPNKQHQKAWIQQHKFNKQQEKMQREQYKVMRKQQKEYEKQQRMANRGNDDYGYRNYPQQPNGGVRNPQDKWETRNPQDKWGLGDILGGIGL